MAAALGAGAAFAVAAIPGSDGVITACRVTNSDPASFPGVAVAPGLDGTLRVIDPSLAVRGSSPQQRSCFANEATITWNQSGPPGVNGTNGAAGAPGARGRDLIAPAGLQFSAAGGHTFLHIPGVDGESKDKGHGGDIALEQFTLGTLSGSTTKRVRHSDFTFVKKIDKSSPALFKALVTGKHFSGASVTLSRKAGGKQQDFLVVTMKDVIITSIAPGDSLKGTPTEQVTLAGGKVSETVLGAGGKHLATVGVKVQFPH